MSIRFIDAELVSGIRSQTIYHGLAKQFNTSSRNTVVLAQPNDPYFSIGYFQDARFELKIENCRKKNIPVVRRETGGGTVFLDRNQIFIQWIFHKGDLPLNYIDKYKLFIQPIVNTYKEFGIEAYFQPMNDVHVNGRKIVGIGGAHIGEAEVITGNFILDFDYSTMLNALNIEEESFKKKAIVDMKKYVTSFYNELGHIPNISTIKDVYLDKLRDFFDKDLDLDSFNNSELEYFNKLDKKMLSDKWLFKVTKERNSEKMLKIHSDVWIGSLNYKQIKLEFQLQFGNLVNLDLIADNTTFLIEEFGDLKLNKNEIRQRVERVFDKSVQYKGENKEFWFEALNKILEMRERYC